MSRQPAPPRRRAARDAQLGLDLAACAPAAALEPGVCVSERPTEPVVPVEPSGAGVASASWANELEQLPVRLLRGLPVPTTLVCQSHDVRWAGCVALRTARAAPVIHGLPDFVSAELDHIMLAAEHDRADLPAWCARKAAGSWVLSAAVAMGQAELGERLVPRGWSLGRVLHRLALRIEEVRLG